MEHTQTFEVENGPDAINKVTQKFAEWAKDITPPANVEDAANDPLVLKVTLTIPPKRPVTGQSMKFI